MTDEAFTDQLFDTFQEETVDFQIKTKGKNQPAFYEAPLAEVVEGMMEESTHDNAWYFLSENLLSEDGDSAAAALASVPAALREPLILPPSLFGPDIFSLFPPRVRPKNHCLIMGGTGARSFLHADPYEWTGVNYLFEGRKLWTFIPPPPQIAHEKLGLVRMKPDAWGEEVSAGWKSDRYDLYESPPQVSEDDDAKITLNLPSELSFLEKEGHIHTVVQEEGDLVVIPPSWAHQVYHLEPGLCLAWQICNRANLRMVAKHILTWAAESSSFSSVDTTTRIKQLLDEKVMGEGGDNQEEDDLLWGKPKIDRALQEAMVLRYGPEKGLKEYEKLMDE